jgi:tetratricopeptide (TPR) repeat protein
MSAEAQPPVRASLVGALLAVAVLAVHARALDAPLLWDDRLLILRSPLVLEPHPLWAYFRAPFWNEGFDADAVRAFFRPLVTLSFRLDHIVGGASPFGFHLTNVVLHAAVTVLVFAWMRRVGAEVLAAAAATALWALHPRLTESVTWVSGRTDVLAALLMFSAMLTWPQDGGVEAARGALRTWAAAALLLLALLAKEVAVAGGIAIVATELLRDRDPRAASKRLLPLGLAFVTYGALRWNALRGAPADDPVHGPWFAPLAALGTYAEMIVDPLASAQIGDVAHPGVLAALGGLLVLGAATFGVTRWARARDPAGIGPACVAALGIALVLHVLPLPVSVLAADRYLYVPLAGVAAAAALATTRATPRVRRALLAAAGAAAVLFGVMTTSRIDDWRDELRFWLVTTRDARTDDTIPLGELANVLYRAGDYAGALPIYQAIAQHGDGPDARRNLSNVAACLAMQGRYEAALAVRQQLADADAGNARRHLDVGLVRLHAREFAQARAEFGRALALAPGYAEARAMLERTDEAEAAWPAVAAADAGDPSRARWLAKLGAREEAQAAYVALAARPDASAADILEAAQYALERGDLAVAETLVPRAADVGAVSDRAPLEQRLHEREATAERVHAAGAEIRALLERFSPGGA